MNRLRSGWEDLRASLWFVPALIVVLAVLLAIGLIELDPFTSRQHLTERWPRLFGAGAEGARGLLSAIASSMITVAGVTFSITVVALALASSQYTSRILANFMRDRANQSVLGVFLGVFAYCLVVLRTIRGGNDGVFVPALAVLGGVLLAFVAIGFLIFFIHHIADSIQATSIIQTTARQTLEAVDRLFPGEIGEAAAEPAADVREAEPTARRDWSTVPAAETGYIQSVDGEMLFDIARRESIVVRMDRAIGDFVIEGRPLVSVTGKAPTEELVQQLTGAYTIGRHRTVHQDAAYGIRQIVDVALKALSPGINDTTTAIICVDFLGAILTRLAPRKIEAAHRSDGRELRLIALGSNFQELLSEAFDQIRQNSDRNVAVFLRLLGIVEILLAVTNNHVRRRAIFGQANLIGETAVRSVPAAEDRAKVTTVVDRIMFQCLVQ